MQRRGVPVADLFNQKVEGAAWKSKPSWYVLANQDQTAPPDLEAHEGHHDRSRVFARTHVVEAGCGARCHPQGRQRGVNVLTPIGGIPQGETVARWSPLVVRRCRYPMSILGPSRHFVAAQ